ncbi:MAG: tRNA 5-methoxyuridine(34)/uridine 5-oxyacetic acid(34) synthase CmoB [Acidiferrobacterales bacterium]
MNNFSGFYSAIKNTELEKLFLPVKELVEYNYSSENHGDIKKWLETLNLLPTLRPSEIDLNQGSILIGKESDSNQSKLSLLAELFMDFQPWRKGPFSLFGISIDTEWRSDWKWDRLKDYLAPLENKTVLDVGCGNGYHCLRILGAGAKRVVGIDPTLLYVTQFMALNRYIKTDSAHVLPLALEDLPENRPFFDTVFSMGVLYHRRDPLEHLRSLSGYLRQGGELVLETLIIEGEGQTVLEPDGRYAKMRNVFQIPTIKKLESWLKFTSFVDVRIVDISITTLQEQRCTEWMKFESLENFLDPNDFSRTIEGWPAPRRAILIAKKAKEF